jgi:hypothetical protein
MDLCWLFHRPPSELDLSLEEELFLSDALPKAFERWNSPILALAKSLGGK